jgi:hypothetical protein
MGQERQTPEHQGDSAQQQGDFLAKTAQGCTRQGGIAAVAVF